MTDLERETARRKFMQIHGRYLSWGYTIQPGTPAEWADLTLMGVVVHDEMRQHGHGNVLTSARYVECGGDREATECLAIDRAIALEIAATLTHVEAP